MSAHSQSPVPPGGQRKSHCCRTCGLPMKGHQRGTCGQDSRRSSSPFMPPPDTIPSGPSQQKARFPSPGARPIMPGAYGNERPSEISASSAHGLGQSPARSLRDRIGPKVEDDSSYHFHQYDYAEEAYGTQYQRHASVPVHGYGSRMIGGSASGYAASASGSAYGSSSTVVMPEHSISQRFIRRDRTASEAPNSLAGRLADRLGGYTSEDFLGPDNGDFDDEGSFEYDDSFDIGDGSDSDPAYPSDGSAIGGGASASYYASESEAGTFTTSGHSSAPSFGALMRGSGAAPLYTVYEVASKYVGLLRNRAKRKGWAIRIIPAEQDGNELDEFGRRKRSSREPGNVRILLGRDEDALKEVERQQRAGLAMPGPARALRFRPHHSTRELPERHSSPLASPPPPHFQSPYPTPQPGLPYPPPNPTAVQQPQAQGIQLRSVCLGATMTLAAIIVSAFAIVGFYVIFSQPSE